MTHDGLEDHGAHLPTGGGGGLDGELVAFVEVLVQSRIKGLAVEDGGRAGVEGAFPRVVGDDILGGAVLVNDMEICPQDTVAVELDLARSQHLPHEVGAVLAPAGGNLDLQIILPLTEIGNMDMIDAVVAGLGVVGVGGVKERMVKRLAIEHSIVVAQTAVVQHRVLHGLIHVEFLDEAQNPLALILSRGDPLPGEGVEATVEQDRGFGVGHSGGGFHRDGDRGVGGGGEGKAVQQSGLAGGLHAATVEDGLAADLYGEGVGYLLVIGGAAAYRPGENGGSVLLGKLAYGGEDGGAVQIDLSDVDHVSLRCNYIKPSDYPC